MSKMREIFESIKSTLHWGPSVEPFHMAVIKAHEEMDDRVSELEQKLESLCPTRSNEPPVYLAPPIPIGGKTPEEFSNASRDAASLVVNETGADGIEQNPAEPGITPVSSFTAQPEPVSAGLDVAETPAPDASTLEQGDDHGAV